jgi:hypothetical protein
VLQATYPNDNSNIFHSTAQVKPQASKTTKLLQLELHKLTTKQEQQQAKQEDTKVSTRGVLECYTEV